MFVDPLLILLVAVASSVLSEVVSYIAIYRKPQYQSLKAEVIELIAETAAQKNAIYTIEKRKKHEKRIKASEDKLAERRRALTATRFKSYLFVAVILFSTYRLLSNLFPGPVARLPFTPFPLLQNITKRGLDADADPTECSLSFLYILCSLSVRPTIEKLFGWAPPRDPNSANPFEAAAAAGKSAN